MDIDRRTLEMAAVLSSFDIDTSKASLIYVRLARSLHQVAELIVNVADLLRRMAGSQASAAR